MAQQNSPESWLGFLVDPVKFADSFPIYWPQELWQRYALPKPLVKILIICLYLRYI